jgi:hypothetical protein
MRYYLERVWTIMKTCLLKTIGKHNIGEYFLHVIQPDLEVFHSYFISLHRGVWYDIYLHNYNTTKIHWCKYKINTIPIWCTRCAFRLIMSLQWYSGRKSWKSETKNCENYIRAEKTQYYAMGLSQIRQRIKLCMREISLCFEMNL